MSQATERIISQLNNGETTGLEFGRTTWRLLEKSGNKVLLLAEDIVDHAPYDRSTGDDFVPWRRSHLRKHIGRDLPMLLFTDAEYECVALTATPYTKNPFSKTLDDGDDDKLFILTIEEVSKYLCNGKSYNLFDSPGDIEYISDEYNKKRVAKMPNTSIDWWWLRTPAEDIDVRNMYMFRRGDVEHRECFVDSMGRIAVHGSSYEETMGGIRPAMWLNL